MSNPQRSLRKFPERHRDAEKTEDKRQKTLRAQRGQRTQRRQVRKPEIRSDWWHQTLTGGKHRRAHQAPG